MTATTRASDTPFRALIVVGAGGIAVNAIRALDDARFTIVEAWTAVPERLEPRRRLPVRLRRGRRETTHVGELLRERQVPLRVIGRPVGPSMNDALDAAAPFDFLLSAGNSTIFPGSILDRLGEPAFNLHPALLPHYRGPRPRHAMLLHDKADDHGGMTLHVLSRGIDEGPIIGQRAVPLSACRDAWEWRRAAEAAIHPLIRDDLVRHLRGELAATPQPPGEGSYFSKTDMPIVIDARFTTDAAERFMERAPMIVHSAKAAIPRADGGTRTVRIVGVPTRLGPPTGAPPRLSPAALEIDLADARVRFARDHLARRMARQFVNRANRSG